jgi:hypothetical protein
LIQINYLNRFGDQEARPATGGPLRCCHKVFSFRPVEDVQFSRYRQVVELTGFSP